MIYNAPDFMLQAERTYLSHARWTGKTYDTSQCVTRECTIKAEVEKKPNGKYTIAVTKGCVTGYESFYVSDIVPADGGKHLTGLSWCAGTPGRYDSLRINADEFNAMCDKLRELGYAD